MSKILDRFADWLKANETQTLTDVREYMEWLIGRRSSEFNPCDTDAVDIRTFLLSLRVGGTDPDDLKRKTASLKRFYGWMCGRGDMHKSPFELFDLENVHIDSDRIRRREGKQDVSDQERELVHLRALNRIAEYLNRSADLKSALDATLNALVEVMDLRTAWLFLWREAIKPTFAASQDPPHDFLLGGSCNLPPSLEQEDRRFLSRSPDCYCQRLLRTGRLMRAVNIVECSRLREAARRAGDTKSLRYHATVPIISQERPLGIINVATQEWKFFNADDLKLLSAASDQIANAIERAELFDQSEKERSSLGNELEMARAVQASFMPEKLPEIKGFSLAAEWQPALQVAGDFYDIFSVDENRWGIVIADVSGKGTPSALYSERAHTLIQEVSRGNPSPSATLNRVNQLLVDLSSDGMFVTVFFAILDPVAGSLTYVNAGHESPFLRRESGKIEKLHSNGPILGVFEEINVSDTIVDLQKGDTLVVYTDGVTEALNPEGVEYGLERLESAISAGVDSPDASTFMEHVLLDLMLFTKNAPQSDDITLFLINRNN